MDESPTGQNTVSEETATIKPEVVSEIQSKHC